MSRSTSSRWDEVALNPRSSGASASSSAAFAASLSVGSVITSGADATASSSTSLGASSSPSCRRGWLARRAAGRARVTVGGGAASCHAGAEASRISTNMDVSRKRRAIQSVSAP